MQLALAPLDGVTHYPFRLLVYLLHPCHVMVTPFFRATGTTGPDQVPITFCPEYENSELALPGVQVIPQFMGSDAVDICRTSEKFLLKAPYIDINLGCPMQGVVQHGAGSALLKNPDLLYIFLSKIKSEFGSQNFSIKIRTGFDDTNNYSEILSVIQEIQPRSVCVHGRTRQQMYTGFADWKLITLAAKTLNPVPVWGSGDIISADCEAWTSAQSSGVFGIQIGRAAIGKPWIFSEFNSKNQENQDQLFSISLHIFHSLLQSWFRRDFHFFRQLIQFNENQISNTDTPTKIKSLKILEFVKQNEVYHPENHEVDVRILGLLKQMCKYSNSRNKQALVTARITDFLSYFSW